MIFSLVIPITYNLDTGELKKVPIPLKGINRLTAPKTN